MLVRFDNVSKTSGTGEKILDQVSFEIAKGESMLVTGHSGAGKTSLLRVLLRDVLPDEGDVLLESQSLRQLKPRLVPQWRRQLGIVFQDSKIIPDLSIWENVALPLMVHKLPTQDIAQRVEDVLKLVELPDNAFKFPSQLSGGELQRVALARALAAGPKLIFADEPTGNLDETTSKHIGQLLQKINRLGTTLVVATHDPVLIKLFGHEHSLVMEKGRVIEDSKRLGGKSKEESADISQKREKNSQEAVVSDKEKATDKKITNKSNPELVESSQGKPNSQKPHTPNPTPQASTRFSLSWPFKKKQSKDS